MASALPHLFTGDNATQSDELPEMVKDLSGRSGILPRQLIRLMIRRKMIWSSSDIETGQIQPASLDLRLGKVAWRIRASFLPGRHRTVKEQLEEVRFDEIDLSDGALLERDCVYVVELQEHLDLQEMVTISAVANPKSSTGRLDIFTRLITDHSEVFDSVRGGYSGPLYAEICPRTFSIKVRTGSRLNQIRFRRRTSGQEEYASARLSDKEIRKLHERHNIIDSDLSIRDGLILRVNLRDVGSGQIVGYRPQKYADVIDLDAVAACRISDYWEPISARPDGQLILDPHQFYILASKEKLHIPPDVAAEMVPIDPMMGEFRVHYAGFFDPGFGYAPGGGPGSRAVLEVRSHEVPFILQDSQIIGRLVYERLTEAPEQVYGEGLKSNYQGQGLKLSKHFV